MESRYRRFVAVAGALIIVMTAYVAWLGDISTQVTRFLSVFALVFVVYAAAVFLLSRLHAPYRGSLTLIIVVAIACRLILLGSSPSLSNDIYRYLWEGRVIAEGHNPFSIPPDAPELENLRNDDYERINHKHLATIYPPLAQGVFLVAAVVAANATMQKVLFVLFDLGTLALIVLLLRLKGRNPNLCAVYAWSPLVIVEFAHSGHMDSIGIFFLILAVYLFERGHTARGMISMGLSFLSKLLPVSLAPFFLLRKKYLVWTPVAVAVAIAGYIPFAGAGNKLWSSLVVYGRSWSFNSLLYRVVEPIADNPDGIRLALATLLALFALYQGITQRELTRYVFRVVACALLLSPTVYPWYATWIIPMLCFHTSRAWLYYTGAVMASYWVWADFPAGGEWRLGTGLLLLEYLPFYLLLVYEGFALVRHRRSEAA